AFSPDGVSPRAVLGSGHRFWNSGDEHDEMGHIEEDPFNRISMMDKRMTKLETAAREIPEMEKFNFFPSTRKQADATLVSWRSTTQDEIYESVKRIISNPTQNKRVVLTHGA